MTKIAFGQFRVRKKFLYGEREYMRYILISELYLIAPSEFGLSFRKKRFFQ